MNLSLVSSVLVAAVVVAAYRNDPTDPGTLTSLSKRISVIPGTSSIDIHSREYSAWMKKCCNRTEYDPVEEIRAQNVLLISNNSLDRIIIAIKDTLTDIFNRARYTDLEFDTNFNKIATALRNLLIKSPELRHSIERICYDVHANMCQIKPKLQKAGMLGYLKYAGLGGYGTYLTEKKYGNHQIEKSRSVLVHMPFVRATKMDVAEAIKIIDRNEWLHKCTMASAVNDMQQSINPSGPSTADNDNDLQYLAGALNTVSVEFENAAKNGRYRNFERDQNFLIAIATELSKIYNKNYKNPAKMFHIDCICHDMYNILLLMRAIDPRKPAKVGKGLFGMF